MAKLLCSLAYVLICATQLVAFASSELLKATQSAGDHRVALVVGNSAYDVAPLKNAANDARAVAKKLVALGFDVLLLVDEPLEPFLDAIRGFEKLLKPGGVGLFFYAGHGVQIDGANYMIPINARLRHKSDARRTLVDASEVIETMKRAQSRLILLLLDACRNDPFSTFRSGSGGIGRIALNGLGTKILYATEPGSLARDGAGENGEFTSAFLEHVGTSGMSLSELILRVREQVSKSTSEGQVVWDEGALRTEFYFAGNAKVNPVVSSSGADLSSSSSVNVASVPPPIESKPGSSPLRTRASSGDLSAQLDLAYRLGTGVGEQKDLSESAKWYSRAAEQNSAYALATLASYYARGAGVPKDERKAFEYSWRAAHQGLQSSQLDLGNFLLTGWDGVVARDEKGAAEWYRKALATDPRTQFGMTAAIKLARMFRDGVGVPKDEAAALQLLDTPVLRNQNDANQGADCSFRELHVV